MKSKVFKDFQFELFGSDWYVEFTDKPLKVENPEYWRQGECNASTFKVTVCTIDRDGNPLKEKDIKINLYHELVHAILDTGQHLNSSADEPLVEWLARSLYSLTVQKVIK